MTAEAITPAYLAYRAACDTWRRTVVLHKQYGRATRAEVDAAREKRDAAYRALAAEQKGEDS
jgi:hypothetical protein